MKILPAIAIIGISLMFQNCGNGSKPKSVLQSSIADTSITTVFWIADWRIHDYRVNTARKIVQNVYKDVPVDSTSTQTIMEKRLTKDSFYLVPIYTPVLDSAKKQVKTLDGKRDSLQENWIKLLPEWVLQDYNRRYK